MNIFKRLKVKESIFILLFSLTFSIFLSSSILKLSLFSNYLLLKILFIFIFFLLVAYIVSFIYLKLCDISTNYIIHGKNFVKNKKKIIIMCFIIIFVFWLPYIISYYPGILMADTADQIRQIFGLNNSTYLLISNPLSTDVVLNDSNPIFSTFLIYIFLSIGKIFSNLDLGIFLFVMTQIILTIGVYSYSIYIALEKGINKKYCIFGLLFYALFPLFPMYAVTVVKNTLFGAFYLIYLFMIYKIIFDNRCLKNKKFIISFIFVQLLIMLLIKHGLYIILLSGLIISFFKFKNNKKLILYILLPVIIFQVGYSNILLPSLNISKGKSAEMFSIPFQQTGRYVSKYKKEITKEEKEVLNKLFVYEKITKNYDPEKSDGMKDNSYRAKHSKEDLKEYFKVWLKQFFKHPICYFEATYINNSGYFNPLCRPWLCYDEKQSNISSVIIYANDLRKDSNKINHWQFKVRNSNRVVEFTKKGIYKNIKIDKVNKYMYYIDNKNKEKVILGSDTSIWITLNDKMENSRYLLRGMRSVLKRVPVINLFFGLGSYLWILLIMISFAILKKNKNLLLFFIPTIISYLILFAGPYAGFRYLYPIVQSVFILSVVTISELATTKKNF